MSNTNLFIETKAISAPVFGMVAEFQNPHDLLEAVKAVKAAGFTQIDTHTPFPIHGMDQAMGLKPTKLPWLVLGGALTGTLSAIAMQFWMNGIDYAYEIGGKPPVSPLAYVPVGFELTVLLGAITTVFGMFAFNFLPRPYHPLFTHERFKRVTDDGFVLSIEASDPRFQSMRQDRLTELLTQLGGSHISLIYDTKGVDL